MHCVSQKLVAVDEIESPFVVWLINVDGVERLLLIRSVSNMGLDLVVRQ